MISKFGLKFAGIKRQKALYLAILSAVSNVALGLPQDGQVTAGAADIQVDNNTMNVQQHSDRVVLEFDSYNVARGETVNYHQPDANSVALNRVVGNNLSEIHGAINANGQVFLINTNGVVFGNGARVHVGGLLVTTLDMADRDFLLGRDGLQGETDAVVINEGELNALGDIRIHAAEVRSSGTISAAESVHLSGSRAALVEVEGSGIPLLIDDIPPAGTIENTGRVEAQRVHLVAERMIDNGGLVRAVDAQLDGGEIVLLAPAGDVVNTGTVVATGLNSGGQVSVASDRYAQTGSIDVTANGHGGSVDIHAQNAVAMHPGSRVTADAKQSGNGGRVILVAEQETHFLPGSQISARGGLTQGNGGFVEVSGHQYVDVQGLVDVGADNGEAGLWFIDPTDIVINNNGVNDGSFVGTDPYTWDFGPTPPNSAQIHIDTISNTLRNQGDVLISTASGAAGNGNITFSSNLDFNGYPVGRTLSLVADGDVNFPSSFSIFDSSPGVEGLNFSVTAGGNISMDPTSSIALGTGGVLTFDGGGDISLSSVSGDSLDITSGGTTTIPDAGLNFVSSIRLVNGDLVDSDRGVLLGAPDIHVDTRAAGGNLDITTDLDTLSVANRGPNDVNFYDISGITLTDIQPEDGLIRLYSGSGSSFILANDVNLDGNSGAFFIDSVEDVQIQGSLTDTAGAVDHAVDISIQAGTNITFDAGALLDAGSGDLVLHAEGNDILLGAVSGASVTTVAANQIIDANGDNLNITAATHTLLAGNGVGTSADVIEANGGELSFAQGSWTVAATGDVFYQATNDLTLIDSTLTGDLSVEVAAGDLLLAEENVSLVGNLTAVAGSGTILINDLGATLTGLLTASASDYQSASGAAARLTVSNADITVTAVDNGPVEINGDMDNLNVTVLGSQAVSISDIDDLQVDQLDNGGDLTIETGSASDLTIADAAPNWGNSLSLQSAGDILLPAAPVSVTNRLQMTANNINDGDNNIEVSAAHGEFQLTANASHTFNTNLDSMGLTSNNSQTMVIVEVDDLQVTDLQSPGDIDLNAGGSVVLANTDFDVQGITQIVTASAGSLTVDDSGSVFTGDLVLDTGFIQDSDNTFSLGAINADLTLRSAAGTDTLNSAFDSAVLAVVGAGTLNVVDVDGLTLQEATSDGTLSLQTTAADLQVSGNVNAATQLTLGTLTSGDVILPAAGLTHAAPWSISTDSLRDVNGTDLALQGGQADISLRNALGTSTWATQLDQLSVSIAGGGDVTVQDADGLIISGAQSDGTLTIGSTDADLELTASNLGVTGTLNLAAVNGGDLVIPDTGISLPGSLAITADDLHDTDYTTQLVGDSVSITLRTGSVAHEINLQTSQLDVDFAGANVLQLSNTGDLQVGQLTTGVNVAIVVNGDLDLGNTSADLTGDLALTSNALLIPEAGLFHSGNLSLEVDSLAAVNGVSPLLQADQLNVSVANTVTTQALLTQASSLQLSYLGTGDLAVDNTGDLQLDLVNSDGNLSVTSSGDLELTQASSNVNGDFSLVAADQVQVVAAGLQHTGNLAITANSLVAAGGGSVVVGADAADIQLSGSLGVDLQTRLNQLALGTATNNTVNIRNDRALVLTEFTADQAAQVVVDVDGNLVVPTSGLVASAADLHISATDLIDSDRTVSMAARSLDVDLSAVGGNSVWDVYSSSLDADLQGTGNLVVNSGTTLVLEDLDGDGRALTLSNGSAQLNVAVGNFVADGDIIVRDGVSDGNRAGAIEINVDSGNIIVGCSRDTLIEADQSAELGQGQTSNAIVFQLRDSVSTEAQEIRLGRDARAELRAIGGDIVLSAKEPDSPTAGTRRVEIRTGSQIRAYNDVSAPLTGRVVFNGVEVPPLEAHRIGAGRTLTIHADGQLFDYGSVLDEFNEPESPLEDTPLELAEAASSDTQFVRVFGSCDELDPKQRQRCRVESALKSFLSHWLVGGEMPPRTEIK